jgi:hypothetical protein
MTFASGLASMAMVNGMMCLSGMVLLATLTTMTIGAVVFSKQSQQRRRIGLGIFWFGVSIPFLCCLGLFNFDDRSHLRRSVHEGMTETEVMAILGKPESVQMDGALWLYHGRWKCEPYGVLFDEKSLVKWTFED